MIKFNERASLNRPAWTSTQSTGMFDAYKHKHLNNGQVKENYYHKGK